MPTDVPKPKPAKTNGTSRLMTVLDQVDRIGNATPTVQVLCQVFKVVDNPSRSEFLAFAKLGRVIDFAEREANIHLDFMWDTIQPHFAAIRTCFVPSFSATPWNQRKTQLTQGDMTGLRHTAKHLEKYVAENELGDEDTAGLREAIREMEAALQSEDGISEHTREVLIERLQSISTALEEYKLWGVAEIERVFRDFAGTFATDQEIRNDAAKAQKHQKPWWTKAIKVIGAIGIVLGTANTAADFDTKTLPAIERMLLLAPAHPSPELPATPHLTNV